MSFLEFTLYSEFNKRGFIHTESRRTNNWYRPFSCSIYTLVEIYHFTIEIEIQHLYYAKLNTHRTLVRLLLIKDNRLIM